MIKLTSSTAIGDVLFKMALPEGLEPSYRSKTDCTKLTVLPLTFSVQEYKMVSTAGFQPAISWSLSSRPKQTELRGGKKLRSWRNRTPIIAVANTMSSHRFERCLYQNFSKWSLWRDLNSRFLRPKRSDIPSLPTQR
jgi:hypothetical protein